MSRCIKPGVAGSCFRVVFKQVEDIPPRMTTSSHHGHWEQPKAYFGQWMAWDFTSSFLSVNIAYMLLWHCPVNYDTLDIK